MLEWKIEVASNIEKLMPYPPGKPIEETKREFGISEVIKLASNENSLGPSPRAVEVICKNATDLHRYPDGSHFNLKNKLSQKFNVPLNEVCIGNGSNEFIDLLIRVFVPKDCNVIAQEKAFIAYRLCAQLQGCEYREAKVDSNFNVTVQNFVEAMNEKTKMVFLANPNNPTGGFLNKESVEELAKICNERKILLVLDYAYWEYVTESTIPDPVSVLKKYRNVIVLKTFSKIYGLAGLRVGYCFADEMIAAIIEKSRQPFNVNSLGLDAATAALDDDEFVQKAKTLNSEGLEELMVELPKLGLTVYPSQGNFVLVDFHQETKGLYTDFLQKGLILRPVANYGLPNFFRISSGLPKENQKLFQVLRDRLK